LLNSTDCTYKIIIEKKTYYSPGTVILSGNFKLVKKIEDLNELGSVKNTKIVLCKA
jgi:hypothetical protein